MRLTGQRGSRQQELRRSSPVRRQPCRRTHRLFRLHHARRRSGPDLPVLPGCGKIEVANFEGLQKSFPSRERCTRSRCCKRTPAPLPIPLSQPAVAPSAEATDEPAHRQAGSPLRPGAAAGAHLRGASRDCADDCMVTQFRVPITRSGLSCLPPPPVPHRAVPSTAVASPSARCSVARCRPILPLGWRFRMMAPERARPQPPSGNWATTSTAASSPTASPVPAALRAGTTSSLPTPASAGASAPPAPPAVWWRPPRIWLTMSSRAGPGHRAQRIRRRAGPCDGLDRRAVMAAGPWS